MSLHGGRVFGRPKTSTHLPKPSGSMPRSIPTVDWLSTPLHFPNGVDWRHSSHVNLDCTEFFLPFLVVSSAATVTRHPANATTGH